MKFSDFTVKRLLSSGDYIVGYDEDGNNIRISKSDLASALASSVQAQSVQVQYSSNGNTWHSTYASGDRYMRIKAGSGAWSSAISIAVSAYDIWLSEGNVGTKEDFLSSLKGEDGRGVEEADLDITRIGGYTELLSSIGEAISSSKTELVSQIKEELTDELEKQYSKMQLSDMKEVKSLAEDDKLTIVTDSGMRKISIDSLAGNIANKLTESKIVSGGGSKPLTAAVQVKVTDWESTEDGYIATVNLPGMTKNALVQASAAPESMEVWMDTPFYLGEVKDNAVVLYAEAVPSETIEYNLLYWK